MLMLSPMLLLLLLALALVLAPQPLAGTLRQSPKQQAIVAAIRPHAVAASRRATPQLLRELDSPALVPHGAAPAAGWHWERAGGRAEPAAAAAAAGRGERQRDGSQLRDLVGGRSR